MITRLPMTTCPVCHGTLDAHGDELDPGDPRPPVAGDYSVCFYCAAILVFCEAFDVASLKAMQRAAGEAGLLPANSPPADPAGAPLVLRLLTAAERAALPADDEVFKVQAVILEFLAAEGR